MCHQQRKTKMLDILYQDAYCIAVNKPAGMLVHRSFLDPHAHEFAMQTLRNQIGQHVYPVHRLDRPTSGVLLFALDSHSAKHLTQQFEQHQVQKTYLAVVRGYLHNGLQKDSKNKGTIDYPLKVILDKLGDKHSLANLENQKNAETSLVAYQSAITHWQTLAMTEQPFSARARYPTSRFSLVQLEPTTGRKHQLRRHMKHIFHPIIGDTSYGDHYQNRAIREHFDMHRLMLHAFRLQFYALENNAPIEVIAPVDMDWQKLLTAFDWDIPLSCKKILTQ